MQMIDLHCDTISKLYNKSGKGKTLLENPYSVDVKRLEKAEGMIQCFSTFFFTGLIPGIIREEVAFGMADRRIDFFKKSKKLCEGRLREIKGPEDVYACMEDGKVGGLLTLEDGVPIGNSLKKLNYFYRKGIRLITLTWNYENALGYPNSRDAASMEKGLKAFGFQAVEEMNRLGILVDVSHLSDGGFWDVVKTSKKPFIASHSNARAVTEHPRNLSDEMIRAIAEKGGVIGLNFCPAFLGADQKSRISHMLRHIKHLYQVGGEEVLAIGTDFDGISGPLEIDSCDKMELLYHALQKHHMPERIIEKMWNGNALRVLLDVL